MRAAFAFGLAFRFATFAFGAVVRAAFAALAGLAAFIRLAVPWLCSTVITQSAAVMRSSGWARSKRIDSRSSITATTWPVSGRLWASIVTVSRSPTPQSRGAVTRTMTPPSEALSTVATVGPMLAGDSHDTRARRRRLGMPFLVRV